jgi:L-lactate dehydrogenase
VGFGEGRWPSPNCSHFRFFTTAYEIIKRKHTTFYAIGLGYIAEAVLRNRRTVLTMSTALTGQCCVDGIAISLRTNLGRSGTIEILHLPISAEEHATFQHSAQALKDRLSQL